MVRGLHVFRTGRRPSEAYAELLVHADTVLPSTISLECFESIARWHPQVVESARDLKLARLASGGRLDANERDVRQRRALARRGFRAAERGRRGPGRCTRVSGDPLLTSG